MGSITMGHLQLHVFSLEKLGDFTHAICGPAVPCTFPTRQPACSGGQLRHCNPLLTINTRQAQSSP